MRIVIIEDEPLTAEDLSDTLLQVDSTIQIEAVLPSVKSGISYFKENGFPDLIFSDIQLGDGLSFEIFKQISTTTPVVFCTAYDEYALDAFKANGIDYILKPFSATSISATIKKFKQLQESFSRKDTSFKELVDLFENRLARKKSSILVYQRDKIIPIPVKDIAICYVENQITRAVCFDQRSYVVNHTLDELEDILGTQFFRANRQHLVNQRAVGEASHYFNRKLAVKLTVPFQDDVVVSKAKSTAFLNWLAG